MAGPQTDRAMSGRARALGPGVPVPPPLELGSRRASAPSKDGKEEYHAGSAVYVRVSTSRQVKLQTIEQQLERVQKHVREKGWELPDENIFRDDGYSGTILGRPGLDALRDRARVRDLHEP